MGDPYWTFDGSQIEAQVAAFAKANGKVTQAQWDAFVASISTLAQALAVCRGLLSSVKCSVP
jgi:formylglycine-generating enzyme required for sulfatase activity